MKLLKRLLKEEKESKRELELTDRQRDFINGYIKLLQKLKNGKKVDETRIEEITRNFVFVKKEMTLQKIGFGKKLEEQERIILHKIVQSQIV